MPNLWTPYAPAQSNGTLPLTAVARSYRYRKELFIEVNFGTFGGSLSQTLTGSWKHRLRASAAPDAAILFEQTVTWKAFIVAIGDVFFGTIAFTTWSPAPAAPGLPPGSGAFESTTIDGQEVPLVDGKREGWRFVDTSTPTANSEQGFTVFDPIGAFSAGGFTFFATFFSPEYLCDIPVGAVYEKEFDHWGIGSIVDEATFYHSFKLGGGEDTVQDPRTGETWLLWNANSGVRCSGTYRRKNWNVFGVEPMVISGGSNVVKGFRDRATLWCLVEIGGNLHLVPSTDEGNTWETNTMSVVSGVRHLASNVSARSGLYYIYGEATASEGNIQSGDVIMVVLARNAGERKWIVQSKTKVQLPVPPKDGVISLEINQNGFSLLVQDGNLVRLFRSSNEGNSWTEASV